MAAGANVVRVGDPTGTPRARGWIHLVFAVVAVVAGAAMVPVAWSSGTPRAGWSALVYVAAIIAMFAVSAVYHRVRWVSAVAHRWMMRVDHSTVFIFIAATYTPLAVVAMPPQIGSKMLAIVWTGAGLGVALKMVWPSTPRWVGVPLYLLLGYVAVWFAETLLDGAGLAVVALLVAGAVLYSIGAVVYGVRWPNPWPQTFGHHEFFHAFTVAAAVCHFVAIWLVVA
ncbi:PAQR family membrane homeostasis protein TrhA [Mycolicibacterium sp. XJ879]